MTNCINANVIAAAMRRVSGTSQPATTQTRDGRDTMDRRVGSVTIAAVACNPFSTAT